MEKEGKYCPGQASTGIYMSKSPYIPVLSQGDSFGQVHPRYISLEIGTCIQKDSLGCIMGHGHYTDVKLSERIPTPPNHLQTCIWG